MAWWLYVAVGTLYWLYNLLSAIRIVRALPSLASVTPRQKGPWPRVSHIVPACNEADQFTAAVGSRLTEGYPNSEFVLVNDRSTDETGAMADRLATNDDRVHVLHIRELPDGWLGKVHALHCGQQSATGDWFLFSDADVHLQPGTLARAITHCERERLDHLCVFPDVWRGTLMLDIVIAMFMRVFCIAVRPHELSDPQSKATVGVGAFNLVRRAAFDKTPGFAGIRLDVIDDLALGQMLKENGARTGVLNGHGYVGVKWYESVPDMARGAEKSAMASFARYSIIRLLILCIGLLAVETAPFVGLFANEGPQLRWVALGGIAFAIAAQLLPSAWFGRPWWPALFVPVATITAVIIMLRGGWLTMRRGGMLWRGTLYPTKLLKQGARLRFP